VKVNGFYSYGEESCVVFHKLTMAWFNLTPARYFRLLMLGCFERIDSERGIGSLRETR
jgi:hypothetical protein